MTKRDINLFSKGFATLSSIGRFYIDGFKEMTIGKTLWAIILVKLFIIFFILKLFIIAKTKRAEIENEMSKTSLFSLPFFSCIYWGLNNN